MNFPGGPVPLDMPLTCNGTSGRNGQVKTAERLPALDGIPTRRLEQLHDELGALACLEPDGPLKDYMLLVCRQAASELTRRANT